MLREHVYQLVEGLYKQCRDGNYFEINDDFIDFGDNSEDHRSFISDWGFVKMDKVVIDVAISS